MSPPVCSAPGWQVLGKAWSGWRVVDDKLYDPAGSVITVQHMAHHVLVYQFARVHGFGREMLENQRVLDPPRLRLV
ncbi:MAG: hypothetical protein V3T39_08050 [Gammaproteobacteria bacterium]